MRFLKDLQDNSSLTPFYSHAVSRKVNMTDCNIHPEDSHFFLRALLDKLPGRSTEKRTLANSFALILTLCEL